MLGACSSYLRCTYPGYRAGFSDEAAAPCHWRDTRTDPTAKITDCAIEVTGLPEIRRMPNPLRWWPVFSAFRDPAGADENVWRGATQFFLRSSAATCAPPLLAPMTGCAVVPAEYPDVITNRLDAGVRQIPPAATAYRGAATERRRGVSRLCQKLAEMALGSCWARRPFRAC